MKPVRTLVLVASEKTARLLANTGVGTGLAELSAIHWADFPDADVEFADRPGRGASPGSGTRHGYDEGNTERDHERSRFAAHIIDALRAEWANGHDRLVVAASPRLLGTLRDMMPAAIKPHVIAELDKDLAKVALHDMADHFDGVLAL